MYREMGTGFWLGKAEAELPPPPWDLTLAHHSLPATVEAILTLGTLGRNDTSAPPRRRACSGAESLRTSPSSKASTCQSC
jgi:hypothetical protein